MKLKTLAAFVLSTASLAGFVTAQDGPPPGGDGKPKMERHRPEGGGDGGGQRPNKPRLTPEEFAKLQEVREQAMENAEVREAGEEAKEAARKFRELLHAEMLRIDPSIADILKKDEARPPHGPGGPGGGKPGGHGDKPGKAGPPPADVE